MAVTVNETETKYDAPAGAGLPGLDRLPGVAATSGPEEQRLEAEYYDTDDLRLIRAGITLRRRSGGADDGWHLKLPLGHGTRREIRRPLGTARRVPSELAALVRVHARGTKLKPVARLTTTRQRLILLDEAGDSLAEVAADDVSAQTLGPATTLSRWQEVEVELTGGDRRLLQAADELLRHDGLRPAGRAAKLERALSGRLPGPEHAPAPTASSSAGQVVLAYLRTQAGRLKSLDPLVRLDEPDSVHQMRVASRRLRSTLRSFGHIMPRDATAGLAADLKWLGGVLGAARDGEVLAGHLRGGLRQLPVELRIGPVRRANPGSFHVRARGRPHRTARHPRLGAVLLAARRSGPAARRAAAHTRGGPARGQACFRWPRAAPTGRRPGGCTGPGARRPGQPGTKPSTGRASRPGGQGTRPRRSRRRPVRRPPGSPGG